MYSRSISESPPSPEQNYLDSRVASKSIVNNMSSILAKKFLENSFIEYDT